MARYSEDFFLNLEHFCCFLFAEFIDLKSHHKFFGCENFQFPFCSWLVSRSGRQLSNDWSLMLVVYRYYILIYHSFLDNFRLGKGIANRPLAWGGNLPTDRATNRIGTFWPWKVNSTWIIDEIDSDTAVRASAQVELSQSLMGLLKASESFVFWVLESFENGVVLKMDCGNLIIMIYVFYF